MRNVVCATAFALALFAGSALPAAAQVAGPWRVTGDIAGHGFVLDCRFEPHDARFGGICVETGGSDSHVKAGKIHTLSQGSFSDRHVGWAYPVSVMFLSFDITFTGTLDGNTISGVVSGSGRKGKFTAARK